MLITPPAINISSYLAPVIRHLEAIAYHRSLTYPVMLRPRKAYLSRRGGCIWINIWGELIGEEVEILYLNAGKGGAGAGRGAAFVPGASEQFNFCQCLLGGSFELFMGLLEA